MAIIIVSISGCLGQFEYDLDSDPGAVESSSTVFRKSWASDFGDALLSRIEGHDTEYAPGYKEDVFRSLEPGSTKATVEKLLGSPLLAKTFPDDSTYWYYSRHGVESENYVVRIVVLNEAGSLLGTRRDFYVD